jgi:hypothetical protein
MFTLRRFGFCCALGMSMIAGTAEANVTGTYGCRFYVDGKVYVEFRIDEIRHAQWAEHGMLTRGANKPIRTDVDVEENASAKEALHFRLPEQKAEIVVANTLEFANARYSGPTRKDLPGECEQADTQNALNRWFIERARERKKGSR